MIQVHGFGVNVGTHYRLGKIITFLASTVVPMSDEEIPSSPWIL